MKRLFYLILTIYLSACTTNVTSIRIGEDVNLTQGKGFILLGVETNSDLKEIKILGPTNIRLTSKDIKEGTNYLIVDLQAGEYVVDKVMLDKYWRIQIVDDEYWKFEIKEGRINYVGHLELIRRGYWFGVTKTELVNRSSEALEFMESNYSNLLRDNAIVYAGPGEDFFFEFLKENEGQ